MDWLAEWPKYCNHILQIQHVKEAHGDVVEFIERALARVSASQSELAGNATSSATEQTRIIGGQVFNPSSNAGAESPDTGGSGLMWESGERIPGQTGLEGTQQAPASSVVHREHVHQSQPSQIALQKQHQPPFEERHALTGDSLGFGSKGPPLASNITGQCFACFLQYVSRTAKLFFQCLW